MSLSKKRIANEVLSSVGIMFPDADQSLLELKMEEILANYEIQRKSELELEEDLEEKIDMYLSAMKIEGLAPGTLYGSQLELEKFAKFCAKPTAVITTNDIRRFLASCDGVMATTLGKKLSSIKSFFGWLVREEILLRDPSAKIKTPKVPRRLKSGLTIEELEIVRESCKSLRERALVEVMYSTGCRLSEVTGMRISQIDDKDFSIRVIGKGNKERVVYLSFKAMYHLKKYLNSRKDELDFLFVTSRRPIRDMTNAAIQKEIDHIEKRAGLKKPLTPHVFRHSFAQLATDAGIDLADLQQLLGHENPSTTLTYAKVSEERKKSAYKKYHVQ